MTDYPEKLVLDSNGSEPSVISMVELRRTEAKKKLLPEDNILNHTLIDFLADYCIENNVMEVMLDDEMIILTLPQE